MDTLQQKQTSNPPQLQQQQQQQQQRQQQPLPDATQNQLLLISPNQFQFSASRVAPGQVSKLKLKNLSTEPVGFKFKTNAPMKYSVKPVNGIIGPGEIVKVFVRSDGWINPQDRFLLQSAALNEFEVQSLNSHNWKLLEPKRITESFIPCSSTSSLTIKEHEEDPGMVSSSSSSTISSVNSNTAQFGSQPRTHQQSFERWQYMGTTRPTISMGGLGRRRSSSSSTCSSASSSPGTYPTLFTPISKPSDQQPPIPDSISPVTPTNPYSNYNNPKRNSLTYNFHGSIITSTIKEEYTSSTEPPSEPARHLMNTLGFSEEQVLKTTSRFKILRQSKRYIFLFALACLLFGMLIPYDQLFDILDLNPRANSNSEWARSQESHPIVNIKSHQELKVEELPVIKNHEIVDSDTPITGDDNIFPMPPNIIEGMQPIVEVTA